MTLDPHHSPYDLLVLGGGTAGLVGARTAAALGARVLLVERARTGGDCLWSGCVPSKSLLAAAHAAAAARGAARFGIHVDGVRVDFAAVMAHVRGAIRTIEPADSPPRLRDAGVEVHTGVVVLTGPTSALVDGQPVAFRQALVATGAEPAVPAVPGLRESGPLTSESVWDLTELPHRLVVLGGGSIGSELAQGFARLGSAVTLVEAGSRLLSREDPRASAVIERALRADGVDVRTGAGVTSVRDGVLRLADGSDVVADRVLVAAGRRPRTDGLGLAAAGVDLDDRGHVVVDGACRTSQPGIWAAGDVTGPPQFTHTAAVHASAAASNAVLGLRRQVDTTAAPRVTFTHPEVGAVGAASGHRELHWDHAELDRAVAEGETDGFTSLVLDRRGRVIGGTVVGPRAGETLGELSLAVAQGLTARALAGTTHAYPTWDDGLWNAAVADVRATLAGGLARRVTGAAVGLRRRRWDRSHRPDR